VNQEQWALTPCPGKANRNEVVCADDQQGRARPRYRQSLKPQCKLRRTRLRAVTFLGVRTRSLP
jgi:hypothetical protein